MLQAKSITLLLLARGLAEVVTVKDLRNLGWAVDSVVQLQVAATPKVSTDNGLIGSW